MNVVKNFYIEYQFISDVIMNELIDKYTIISYDELIAEADKYIHNIIFERIQKENREREKKENEYHNELYFKEEREREERDKKVDKKSDKKVKKSK
jgi:dihydrofolate reductase